MAEFQTVRQKRVRREWHVWTRFGSKWKCVLCGGISGSPSDDCEPERYVPLTADDRAACPLQVAALKGGLQ